jgi:hypothetical protein
VILFDREPVVVVMLRFKLGCWLLVIEANPPVPARIYHAWRHSLAKL